MFFLSGKGCSEFPKRMLISIGILTILDALDKYRIHKDQALHGYHVLKEQLTEDQAAALDQVMDENLNLLADELEQNFRNGFCLGVKMMCEVFGK